MAALMTTIVYGYDRMLLKMFILRVPNIRPNNITKLNTKPCKSKYYQRKSMGALIDII